MVTENVDIRFRETGARVVKRRIDAIGAAANSASRSIFLFQRALFVLGGAGIVTGLVNYADALTQIENRLKLTTTSTQNLEEVQARLFEVAQRSRTGFVEIGDIYSRVALSTRQLGISQEETAAFTESLAKATILSGASAREANAALVQLGQGLASNRLSGDELRSVLEQLPFVADVIARQLGITRGELRQFGRDGKISAEVVVEAFRNARDEINALFEQTTPTVAQAFTVLNNEVLRFVDAFDDASGASGILANAIIQLSSVFQFFTENVDTVINVLETLGIVLGVTLASVAIPALTGALVGLFGLLAANPFATLILALTTGVAAIIAFKDELLGLGGEFSRLVNTVFAFGELVRQAFASVVSVITGVAPAVEDVGSSFDSLASAATSAIEGVVNGFDFLIAAADAAVAGIISAWNNLPGAFVQIAQAAINGAIAVIQAGINQIIGLINQIPFVGGGFGGVDLGGVDLTGGVDSIGNIGGDIGAAFNESRGFLNQQFEEIRKTITAQNELRGSIDETAAAAQESVPFFQESANAINGVGNAAGGGGGGGGAAGGLDQLRNSFESLLNSVSPLAAGEARLAEVQNTLNQAVAAGITSTDQAAEVYRRLFRELVGVGNAQTDAAEKQQLLNRALEEGVISASEFNSAVANLSSGASEQFNFFQSAAEKTFNAASSALSNFVRTGEFDFSQFTRSLLADLTQLAANQLFQQLLGGGGGGLFGGGGGGGIFGGLFGGGGGLFGGLGGLFGFANGGDFRVGGRGGIDNNLLSINNRPVARVSRGEMVTVSPNSGGNQRPTQINFAISTPTGEIPKRTQEQIAARTATALRRADRRDN